MRDLSRAAGIVLALVGLVWILQGFDVAFAPQSFMTGDLAWVAWGVVAMVAGGILFWRGRSGTRASAESDLGGLSEQDPEGNHEDGDDGKGGHGRPEDGST
jgi:xanthosine utilization system XapX-like protein